jgi:hypothetical protein
VDQRPVDAGLVHVGNRLFGQVGFLAMVGGRRAFLPEVDLAIDDDHWRFLFRNVPKCSRKARPNATLK